MTRKRRRVIYNDDGNGQIYYPHPMTLGQFYDCVDQMVGSDIG